MASPFDAEVNPVHGRGFQNPPNPKHPVNRRVSSPQSCLHCLASHVRCDGHSPCERCKSTQQTCVFAPLERGPHRRSRTQGSSSKSSAKQDLESRLAVLESLVKNLSGRVAANSSKAHEDIEREVSFDTQQTVSPSVQSSTTQEPTFSPFGLSLPAASPPVPTAVWDTQTHVSQLGSLSGRWDEMLSRRQFLPTNMSVSDYLSTNVDLKTLRPSPLQRTVLWHFYRVNIEILVKILHVPTIERIINRANNTSEDLDPEDEALLFAIYYAAITTMNDKTLQMYFDSDRPHLLARYSFATEQCLAKANFLTSTDMRPLQAFALFLTVARRNEDTRVCWALTGMAIRIAQGLRVHYDGTLLGLSPFETEMRRRLWWTLCALDIQFVEELGTDPVITTDSFSTEFPSNINDSDIGPNTKLMPTPREGMSDCIVPRIRYEIFILFQQLLAPSSDFVSKSPPDATSMTASWEKLLTEVYERLESTFLKYCLTDPNPVYQNIALSARVILMKAHVILYQPRLGKNYELPAEVRSRILDSAIYIIEYHNSAVSNPGFQSWKWLLRIHTQWHSIALVLLESLRRPWDAESERGWVAVKHMLADTESESNLKKSADQNQVWAMMQILLKKAHKHREEWAQKHGDLEAMEHTTSKRHSNPATKAQGTHSVLTQEQEAEYASMLMSAIGDPNEMWACINDVEMMLTHETDPAKSRRD